MLQDGTLKTFPVTVSSYNEPLYIGNGGDQPKPGEVYVRLHELIARIFKMRGHA
jgi:hypothetical protein